MIRKQVARKPLLEVTAASAGAMRSVGALDPKHFLLVLDVAVGRNSGRSRGSHNDLSCLELHLRIYTRLLSLEMSILRLCLKSGALWATDTIRLLRGDGEGDIEKVVASVAHKADTLRIDP